MKFLVALAIILVVWRLFQRRRPAMSVAEARAVLELPPGADASAIRAAHRRLMRRVHPDAGGTAALAARVNAARDLLVMDLQQHGR